MSRHSRPGGCLPDVKLSVPGEQSLQLPLDSLQGPVVLSAVCGSYDIIGPRLHTYIHTYSDITVYQ